MICPANFERLAQVAIDRRHWSNHCSHATSEKPSSALTAYALLQRWNVDCCVRTVGQLNTRDLPERSTRLKDSTSAESRTTWEARTRTFWISAWGRPGARTTAQSWRLRTRFLSPGSAAAAASCRSAGCPPWWGAAARPRSRCGAPRGDAGVVDFVETLHGLVAVVLPALQQVMHGHGAAVVVEVVAALRVGLRLDTEARLRGCAACRTCCCRCAARSAEAAWRRSCRWRTGRPARLRPRCPAEAGRACSPAPSPCRGQDRRLRPRPVSPLPLRQLLPRQPAFQQPCPRARAAALRPHPQRHTPSAATGAVSSMACAVTGPAYDPQRPARLQAPALMRSAAACAPSAVLRRRSVMEGGP